MNKTQIETIRRRALFRGSVQGVGFRFTACKAATGYAVTGYVRNLPAGEVEVVAEGPPAAVDGFIGELARRMDGCISGTKIDDGPARGEFEQFEVRF